MKDQKGKVKKKIMNALYHEDDEAENQPSQFTKYNFFHFIYQLQMLIITQKVLIPIDERSGKSHTISTSVFKSDLREC